MFYTCGAFCNRTLVTALAFSSSIFSINGFVPSISTTQRLNTATKGFAGIATVSSPILSNMRLMSSSTKKLPPYETGDIVTIDYSLQNSDSSNGSEQDPSYSLLFDIGKDISFALNAGNYLPGLHSVVSSLSPGESVKDAEVDAGFGDVNPQLIATIPKTENSGLDYNLVNVGTELMLANGMKAVVTEVTENDFTIDANPRMAGKSFLADVTLHTVEPGPSALKYTYVPEGVSQADNNDSTYEVATFALGCFWGGELAYMREEGVVSTKVGYTQGKVESPSYQEVCSGTTGHTEGIQIVYDPSKVSYERLVELTMERLGDSMYKLNQVGNDRGTQYRHGIYYHDDKQKEIAESIISSFGEKCVTECLPTTKFWDAEDYHQQYLMKGGQSAKKKDMTTIRCYG